MALGIHLDLKQSQQLVMTPQLQQAIRLLQMSSLELADFVAQEIESNPLLAEPEQDAPAEAPLSETRGDEALDRWLERAEAGDLGAGGFDSGTENLYDGGPGETGDRATVGRGGDTSFEEFEPADRPGPAPTLREHLLAQISQTRAAPAILTLARLIVEELDETGYFRHDLAKFSALLGVPLEVAEAALALVQSCDPTGVAARCLTECLALQLAERDRLDPAMRRLLDNLDLLARGDRRRLKMLCGVDDADLSDMVAELRSLNPRPSGRFEPLRAEARVADILVTRGRDGGWVVELNPETQPRVLIDTRYAVRLEAAGGETRSFAAECRARASWLARSLDQRARSIVTVASEIVRRQDAFFREGIGGLKPMTLAMVAEATGLHESTVSRVTSQKYAATERGLIELKFFFTNAVGTDGLSAETVRHRIREMIGAERPDAVLSDDAIVEILQKDGIDIARRTVAKYRIALGIPSSVERRRHKAMAAS